jgi:hypothetical protein
MGYVPYVGFATYRCTTVMTRFFFYKFFLPKKKKKKKKRVITAYGIRAISSRIVRKNESIGLY